MGNTRVVTGPVRLSYPYLFSPRARDDDKDPEYSTMILIPKSDKATLTALREAEKQAAENGKTSKFGGTIPKFTSIIHDGDEEADTSPERAGYWYMTVSSSARYKPGIVDKNLQPILDQSEVYPGVNARVSVDAYPYNAKGKKGVTFGLQNVQILGGGENLAGERIKPEDEFEVADSDLL